MKFKYTLLAVSMLYHFACKEAPKEQAQQEAVAVAAAETQAPKSTFEDLNGNPIELSDYRGKKILLNFWATWCRPCIEEMPSLLNAQAALANDNYVFLLASDQSMEKITAFKEKKGFNFNYVKFHGAMADFEVTALPATFIYNAAGTKVERIDGATEWDAPETIDLLKAVE